MGNCNTLQYYIGCSGWNYKHWQDVFYPKDVPQSKWFLYYTNFFNTVEINATFYHSFKDSVFKGWYNRAPENFCYSIKMSKYITHIKRLRDVKNEIDSYMNLVSLLKEKLGVILIQLPPSLKFDATVISDFLSLLPGNYRYTIEARNVSWLCDSSFALLQSHNIAWCISDTAGRYPYYEVITADFIYIRLHGSTILYASSYTDKELEEWAQKISTWKKVTYCYFDNDYNAYAPYNAIALQKLLKLSTPSPCSEYIN